MVGYQQRATLGRDVFKAFEVDPKVILVERLVEVSGKASSLFRPAPMVDIGRSHTERRGCIRVAEPIELAEYLLQHDKRWTRKAIISATQGSGQRTVNLPEKIPVYLLYWTAWVDEDGTVQFREDIYQRDQRLARAWNGDRLTGA